MKIRKLYRRIAIVLSMLLLIVFTTGETINDEKILNEVREAFKLYYVDDVPDNILDKPSVGEILAEINKTDPYTKYYANSKYQEYISSVNNESSIIGLNIELVPEGVKVVSLRYGTPENEAGIMAGDIILVADNHILVGLNKDAALSYIKGKDGTTVKLKVERGDNILDISVVQRRVSASLVGGQILDKHIGYIKIDSFGESSGKCFGNVVQEFEKKKVDSYIVDLRYNNGGFRNEALDIAGYFIGCNYALISRGRLGGINRYRAKFHGFLINKPVIFLVNQYTASASEILVGAVKDYNKAYIIGTRTYGKGSSQWSLMLYNNDVLKLTYERNYTPSGYEIDKVGIYPDLNMSDKLNTINVAELILDSPGYVKDVSGYVRIELGKKIVYASLKKVQTPQFWQGYRHLLNAAVKGGSVMIGTNGKWVPAPKNYLFNMKRMYYPDYKDQGEIKNQSPFFEDTLNFPKSMNKNFYNNSYIQLVNTQTGIKEPLDFTSPTEKSVTISPKNILPYGSTYYVIVQPGIRKSDNKPLGKGQIFKFVIERDTK